MKPSVALIGGLVVGVLTATLIEEVHNVRRDALLYYTDMEYHSLNLALHYSSADTDKLEKRSEFIQHGVLAATSNNSGSTYYTMDDCFFYLYPKPNMKPIENEDEFQQAIKDKIKEWKMKNR